MAAGEDTVLREGCLIHFYRDCMCHQLPGRGQLRGGGNSGPGSGPVACRSLQEGAGLARQGRSLSEAGLAHLGRSLQEGAGLTHPSPGEKVPWLRVGGQWGGAHPFWK